MKKYIIGAVLTLGMLASPVFASAAGLTSTQIQSILSLLSTFGADSATVANVSIALNGGTPTAVTAVGNAVGTSFCYNFNSDLAVGSEGIDGSSGTDVDALVTILLNDIPSFVAGEGALKGFFTKDVEAGVVKFQAKYGIRQTGYVGPLTRGKLNALYECNIVGGEQVAMSELAPIISSVTPASARIGQTVTVYANFSDFARSTENISVVFDHVNMTGDIRVYPSSVSGSSLSFVVPVSISIGAHTIELVSNNYPTSNFVTLNVVAP